MGCRQSRKSRCEQAHEHGGGGPRRERDVGVRASAHERLGPWVEHERLAVEHEGDRARALDRAQRRAVEQPLEQLERLVRRGAVGSCTHVWSISEDRFLDWPGRRRPPTAAYIGEWGAVLAGFHKTQALDTARFNADFCARIAWVMRQFADNFAGVESPKARVWDEHRPFALRDDCGETLTIQCQGDALSVLDV